MTRLLLCTAFLVLVFSVTRGVHATLKRAVKDAGLKRVVRVNHAGCMNQFGHGPMVVVYPEDTWYAGVDEKGAQRIVDEHLVHGRVVDKYRYVAPPGDNKRE